jgi:hypothetical protein
LQQIITILQLDKKLNEQISAIILGLMYGDSMKNLLIAASAFLALSANAENSPKVFAGKYTVLKCPLYSLYSPMDYSRAYIYTHTDKEKFTTLEINLYGDMGAMLQEFPLSNHSRQAPGTDISIHERVTETTQVEWKSPTDVVLTTRTVRPSFGLDETQVSRLTLKNGVLKIKSNYVSEEDTCLLQKL